MKRGAKSGWQLRNTHEIPPPSPTRWERFCYAQHIDDPLKALRNGQRGIIHEWVLRNRDSAFVPEDVMEFLGMSTRWE